MKNPNLYAVGQHVELAREQVLRGVPLGVYTVIRLLPNNGTGREYVLRNKNESHDRVVPESMIRLPPQGLAQKVFA
jgi:hypothetical protein